MSKFQVVEHKVRCQHIRERLGSVEPGFANDLKLAVKQYIPSSNTNPQPGDITIIGAHANAFPKELYEPLWDELQQKLEASGTRIRSIWIADVAHQGQSGVINERIIGNDPSWFDHARDLLFMINQFQDEMPAPIIGIGHSMGGMHLTHMALFHPRLLHALILIDPVIQSENPNSLYAVSSTYRRDIWPSRKEAAEKFRSNKFYQRWDTRVLDRWIQHGLRELPTETYPNSGKENTNAVTLTTPKAQEVYTFLRPLYEDETRPPDYDDLQRDLQPEASEEFAFHRPGPAQIFARLPELRPTVLYIFGEHSDLSPASARKSKVQSTGIGPGGSGGVVAGRVKEVSLDAGHLVPMERVEQTADQCASFIQAEVSRWKSQMDEFQRQWNRTSRRDKITINDKWREHVGPPPGRSKGTKDGQPKM